MSISSTNSCYRKEMKYAPILFTIVGFVSCPEFQEAMTLIELLHQKYPREFPAPLIRPMLEFDWIEFLIKAQRRHGGKLWSLNKPFIVYVNGRQLGCYKELEALLATRYYIRINRDYNYLAQTGLIDMYEKYMEIGRKFVFFAININTCCVGHLIIMLYSDLVPKTCDKFLKKCTKKKNGYRGLKVHRIMKNSWIQCADFVLPLGSMPNENYIVPHNRRGILSMCNNNPHLDNKTQFFITLDSTPWMDHKYVAFGKIMQGECLLHCLESQIVKNQSPLNSIFFSNCGEITLEDTFNAKNIDTIYQYFEDRGSAHIFNYTHPNDVSSILLEQNYQQQLYCHPMDAESHLPLNNIPSNIMNNNNIPVLPIIPAMATEEIEVIKEDAVVTPSTYMEEEPIQSPEHLENRIETDVTQNMSSSLVGIQSGFNDIYIVEDIIHELPKKHIKFLDAEVPNPTRRKPLRKKHKIKEVIDPTD